MLEYLWFYIVYTFLLSVREQHEDPHTVYTGILSDKWNYPSLPHLIQSELRDNRPATRDGRVKVWVNRAC